MALRCLNYASVMRKLLGSRGRLLVWKASAAPPAQYGNGLLMPVAAAALMTGGVLCKNETQRSCKAEETQDSLGSGWSGVPPRLAALHTLLLDLAKVPEATQAPVLPSLLEVFWEELASSGIPKANHEFFLHRLADSYGHGTLRKRHAQRLASSLKAHGVHSVLDPLAHTGFHGSILAAQGFTVELADSAPSPIATWSHVIQRPAENTQWSNYGVGWALFLSWLPYWNEMGCESLQAFQGSVVIVLGDEGRWTATESFRQELLKHWDLLESWPTESPWPRVDEKVSVYIRKCAS